MSRFKSLSLCNFFISEIELKNSYDEYYQLTVSFEMKDKKAIEVMIPINKTFMVSYDSIVDNVNLSVVLEKGFSRIPVYANNNSLDIIGLVRIKQLIGIDLTERKSMRQHGILVKRPLRTYLKIAYKAMSLYRKGLFL